CYDGLQRIFEEYGHFKEKTISITMSGISGAENIQRLMNSLRVSTPASFGGVGVEVVEDYLEGTRQKIGGQSSKMDFGEADVLKYYLEDRSWIAARPSGTEPKIKFYIGAVADSKEAVDQKVQDFEMTIDQLIGD